MTDTPEIARIRAALEMWTKADALDDTSITVARIKYNAATDQPEMAAVLAHIDAQAAVLASISAELGLPPTIGPAPGVLAGLLAKAKDQAAEIDALRADAARYRWLRDPCAGAENAVMYGRGDFGCGLMSGAMLDDAIDAAMGEKS